jgi:hypothetical protein
MIEMSGKIFIGQIEERAVRFEQQACPQLSAHLSENFTHFVFVSFFVGAAEASEVFRRGAVTEPNFALSEYTRGGQNSPQWGLRKVQTPGMSASMIEV